MRRHRRPEPKRAKGGCERWQRWSFDGGKVDVEETREIDDLYEKRREVRVTEDDSTEEEKSRICAGELADWDEGAGIHDVYINSAQDITTILPFTCNIIKKKICAF